MCQIPQNIKCYIITLYIVLLYHNIRKKIDTFNMEHILPFVQDPMWGSIIYIRVLYELLLDNGQKAGGVFLNRGLFRSLSCGIYRDTVSPLSN